MHRKQIGRMILSALPLGLVACDPLPERGEFGVSLASPTQDQGNVPLVINTTATIDGGFNLVESPCDPSSVEASDDLADHLVYPVQPLWNPDDCMDEDGQPTAGEGNIQVAVDGFFVGYYTGADVTIDLSPKLPFAIYDTAVYDEDGDEGTTDDQEERSYFVCNLYYPADNLGYAELIYNTYMAGTLEDAYGTPLYGLDDEGEPTELLDPQPVVVDFLGAVSAPWLYFSYQGMYDQFTQGLTEQHVFTATLHHTNHSAVYGTDFERVITGGFDLSSMPDDWCGHLGIEPLRDVFGLYE